MKTKLTIIILLVTGIMYSQKSKNGTVYKEHPAIVAVEGMLQAFFTGDENKTASYLADDFMSLSGTSINKNDKGSNKESFLKGVKWVQDNWSYISYKRSPGAYPDAIEYNDAEDGVWVQTWDELKAVDNRTGVRLDMPIHRLFRMNNDNKIVTMFTYDNDLPWAEVNRSFEPRKNGTIYNNHDNINTVRKVVGAMANSDVDKAFSYFTEDATFTNLDMKRGESHTIAQEKEIFKGMSEIWTIDSIDVVGYPDYLEYELGNAKVVQSWWDVRLTKKSDGKKVVLPMLLVHDFNDEGKITREAGYYTAKALE